MPRPCSHCVLRLRATPTSCTDAPQAALADARADGAPRRGRLCGARARVPPGEVLSTLGCGFRLTS
jgi:hypothetical protein